MAEPQLTRRLLVAPVDRVLDNEHASARLRRLRDRARAPHELVGPLRFVLMMQWRVDEPPPLAR